MMADDRRHIVVSPAEPTDDRPSRYDVLFDSVRIGPKVMRNRFYQTPHCSSLGTLRPGSQARLRGTKAEGGWAVVNTEYCSIHPEADDWPWVAARLWDDTDVQNLSAMTDAVHEHGSLAGVQLWYGGSVGSNLETRTVSRGVSQIPNEGFPSHSCYAMTTREIRDLQGLYVKAARRAVAAGFDIVILGAQEIDNICMQFLLPFYNHRSDEYGGSLENRARFIVETLDLIREAVSDQCAVTARLCVDSLGSYDRGIRAAGEGIGVVELADPLVDFWDVQVGGWYSAQWGEDAAASRFSNENWQSQWIQSIRGATAKPLVGVGRFTSPDTMVSVIRSGQQDIIGAARPSIADPFLPKKIEEGRFEELRECIGCNICVSRFSRSTPIACTQNPTLGEEYRRGWHPEQIPAASNTESPVLVVGAGPAGLECAVTLGKRGFQNVHLVDAAPKPGGSLRWIARLPGLAEWIRVIDYREAQIAMLPNVEFVPNTSLDYDGILDYGGSLVIMATGSRWATNGINWATHEPIPGVEADSRHIFTPEQIAVDQAEVDGDRVVIYDCDGYFMGVSLAELLQSQGKQVTIVTPFSEVAPEMLHTLEHPQMVRRLTELGIEVVTSTVVDQITRDGLALSSAVTRDAPTVAVADAVVLVTQRCSEDRLYRQLEQALSEGKAGGIEAVYRIGDCHVPRLVADAIFDGHRLAREIDTDDPATPLPYRRENLVLSVEAPIAGLGIGA